MRCMVCGEKTDMYISTYDVGRQVSVTIPFCSEHLVQANSAIWNAVFSMKMNVSSTD